MFGEGSGPPQADESPPLFSGIPRGKHVNINVFLVPTFFSGETRMRGGCVVNDSPSASKNPDFHLRYKVAGIARKSNLAKPVARGARTENLIPPPLLIK